MTKAELEKKSLADLHALAAEAGVERFRLLTRAELVARLGDGGEAGESASERPSAERSSGERPARRRSRGGRGSGSGGGRESRERSERPRQRETRAPEPEEAEPEQSAPPESPPPPPVPAPAAPTESSARPRRRRRRRFGRRGKQGVTLQGLLLPPAGRQALLAAESREACTALLRGIAADLSAEANGGPDPVALLIDPSPEELGDWRRDAPQAEIVAAGQARHADDALAQAVARANSGDHVILLVDSLTRLGEAHGDADAAKDFFDAGRSVSGAGSLTVVAALERS